MEWTRLSDLTGNQTYAELAAKAESYLIDPLNPEVGEPYPGLLGSDVSIANGSFTDSQGGWTGGTDSYYEYLIKMYLYDPIRFSSYKDSWVKAVDSSIQYLASHPTSRPDLTFLSYYYNGTEEGLVYYSEHRKSTPTHYSLCLFASLAGCLAGCLATYLFVACFDFDLRQKLGVWAVGDTSGCTALKTVEGGGQGTRHEEHMRRDGATRRCPTVRICRTEEKEKKSKALSCHGIYRIPEIAKKESSRKTKTSKKRKRRLTNSNPRPSQQWPASTAETSSSEG